MNQTSTLLSTYLSPGLHFSRWVITMMQTLRHWILNAILIAALIAVSAAGGAWWHYRTQERKYENILKQENARLKIQKDTLQSMIKRLTKSKRLAQIVVTNQTEDHTTLLIAEIDDQNQNNDTTRKNTKILSQQSVTIKGQIAFFDGLVIKFDKDSVAKGDPFRGESIAIFRRVYSENEPPSDGYILDQSGEIPAGYQTKNSSTQIRKNTLADEKADETREEFEKRIWSRFWVIANDPTLAKQLGIRVAQGEAVYKPMKPGILYELTLDAAGGLNLQTKPLPDAVSQILAAASQPNH